ncbi:MAG: protein kinase [Vicinamibacterales bacterium]
MPLAAGAALGPYEILGALGSGGMGQVYRARDPRLGRDVAIKLIAGQEEQEGVVSPEHALRHAARIRRFEQEARTAGRLNHPNVLTVYDVGHHDGVPFIVAELLRGETLRTRLQHGALPVRTALEYARQMADGLAAAHGEGVVHCDIKPENVFVTREERVKILDFGIAKLATMADDDGSTGAGSATETSADVVAGTAAYMSPEQIRADVVDARSDIFSVGIVLHEMLTGRSPFARSSVADTMAAVLRDEPPGVAIFDLPPGLAPVVARCLAKAREARFQSARDLAFHLSTCAASMDSAAGIGTIESRRSRSRSMAPLAVMLAIVGLALGAQAVWRNREPPATVDPFAGARFSRLTDWEGVEGAAEISPDGRLVTFMADREGAFDVWLYEVGSGRFENLTHGAVPLGAPSHVLRQLGFNPDGSGIWMRMPRSTLIPTAGGAGHRFLEEGAAGPAWSPDGRQIAYFINGRGDPLFVSDPAGSNPRRLIGGDEDGVHTHNPVWSLDGQWIYFVRGASVGSGFEMDIWRIRPSGEAAERLSELKTTLNTLAPIDDRTLLYVARDRDQSGPWLFALDLETRMSRRVVAGLEPFRSVSASRDGRRVVATVSRPTTTVARVPILNRLADDRDVQLEPAIAGLARAVRFRGTSAFYFSPRGTYEALLRADGGAAVEILKNYEAGKAPPVAISPDGRQLAMVLERDRKPRVTVVGADGTSLRVLSLTIEAESSPDWSPDGRWIVVAGSDPQGPGLFKVAADTGAAVRLVAGRAINPVWSPDGSMILYNGPIVGGMSELLGVKPDGTSVKLPAVQIRPGGQRLLPDGRGLVYQYGADASLEFWLLDLTTGTTRQLTRFASQTPIMSARAFDITPDGQAIVFDRLRDNSDIALIELTR